MTKPLLFPSPLRYPGSKRRLAGYVQEALAINHMAPTLYVEPFVGGASVGLQLMHVGLVDKVIFVDRDPWIASFWSTVFWDTDWLVERIEKEPVTLEAWHVLKQSEPTSTREQAWACLFLNRTSFSGILRQEVGPIGGKKQDSQYKIDCRFPRHTLIQRIRYISTFREHVYAVWATSWEEALAEIREAQVKGKLPGDNVFFYLDPPFFRQAETLYRYYFTIEDHRRLRDALLCLEDKWLLSYDSADEIEILYAEAIDTHTNGAKKSNVELLYSLSKLRERKRGQEIILSNLEILPEFNVSKPGGRDAKY